MINAVTQMTVRLGMRRPGVVPICVARRPFPSPHLREEVAQGASRERAVPLIKYGLEVCAGLGDEELATGLAHHAGGWVVEPKIGVPDRCMRAREAQHRLRQFVNDRTVPGVA